MNTLAYCYRDVISFLNVLSKDRYESKKEGWRETSYEIQHDKVEPEGECLTAARDTVEGKLIKIQSASNGPLNKASHSERSLMFSRQKHLPMMSDT